MHNNNYKNSAKKPTNCWVKNNLSQNKDQNTSKNVSNRTELKFKEAQRKLHAAVQKYVKDYDSSSEEEEVQAETVITSILKNYEQCGGKNECLGRTEGHLIDSFSSGANTCLVCISKVKRIDEVWSCKECFCLFHLMCIQRWSKDTITHKKLALEDQIQVKKITLTWGCPKCRYEYNPDDIPDQYKCYCGRVVNPSYEPLIAPHSCGETCRKPLKPICGHTCVLLCHPGPCPPCPKTVEVKCYCGSQPAKLQRCSNKEWSCGKPCGKPLQCGKHSCTEPCHAGECKPCPKKSVQKCLCRSSQKLRDCSSPLWQCDRVCDKPLSCGNHTCSEICHPDKCRPCILSQPRNCPCGKTKYELPCTEETPTCGDTCGKVLECGLHTCNQRCHKEKCGQCLETVTKLCKCGLHEKEVQCKKQYLCETKCKRMKDCNKHPCNRKCCDGNCPPCEKPCGKTLSCGNHKCASICHRGPCYPCSETEIVSCRCGKTAVFVPCGRKHKTKPPKCLKLCSTPPECHHQRREPHRCHFGDCPPCKQVCNKSRTSCSHLCPAVCHSSVLVEIKTQKPSMPWEQSPPVVEKKAMPCPDCVVPVPVTCLGKHETSNWPCYLSKPSSCHKPCGRILLCGNHTCSLECHVVEGAPDDVQAGVNCETCERGCEKPRPDGCSHVCPKPCHPGDCPPCKQMIRIKCHCGLNQPYVACKDWTNKDGIEALQSCGNQCPNNYDCGHRCKANCHSGPCPNPENCKKKVKISCPCKRIKKEFQCEIVRKKEAIVECDEICLQKINEEKKRTELLMEQKKKEEDLKNRRELEKYEKMFQQKKKSKERKIHNNQRDSSYFKKYWIFIVTIIIGVIAILISFNTLM